MWSASTLIFAGLLAGPPAEVADEESASRVERSARVEINYSLHPDDGEALANVLRAELAPLVDVSVEALKHVEARDVITAAEDAAPGVVARVWIASDARDHVTLYLVDELGERILIRKVPLADPGSVDEIAREQLAAILASAVEALLDGAHIGMEREVARNELGFEAEPTPPPSSKAPAPPPPPPPPPPEPPPPHSGSPGLMTWLELGYQQTWARPIVGTQGPRLALDLERRSRIAPGGTLSFSYQAPGSFESKGVEVLVQGFALRAAAGVGPSLGRYVRLRAQLGAGVDLLFVQPRRSTIGVSLEDRVFKSVPMAGAMFGVTVRVIPALEMRVAMVGDVDLVDTRFVVDGAAGGELVLYDPWRVRPGFRLSLAWDVLGRRASRAATSGGV